jgi:hypothetical protein
VPPGYLDYRAVLELPATLEYKGMLVLPGQLDYRAVLELPVILESKGVLVLLEQLDQLVCKDRREYQAYKDPRVSMAVQEQSEQLDHKERLESVQQV